MTMGVQIQIDPEEIELFSKNTKSKFVVFKRGVANVDKIVCVVPDTQRQQNVRNLANGTTELPPALSDAFPTLRSKTNTQNEQRPRLPTTTQRQIRQSGG